MIGYQWPYAVATLVFAAGLWTLLPRGRAGRRRLGVGLCAVGAAGLILLVHCGLQILRTAPFVQLSAPPPRLGDWGADSVFLVLAGVTIASAIGAVTLRSPVYCAIWFAMTLLGSSGLFLYQGAQFLGVATVVVYAGAILVTFLFVLMLAQPAGHAYYDRVTWEALLSSCAGAVLVGVLTMTTSTAFSKADGPLLSTSDPAALESGVLAPQHVARLGAELFSRHLIAVEVAGTLLLVALVGAVAIASFGQSGGAGHFGGPTSAGGGRSHG